MKYIIKVAEKYLIKETHKMFSTSFKISLNNRPMYESSPAILLFARFYTALHTKYIFFKMPLCPDITW